MHKLVIMIEESDVWAESEDLWPRFLHLVEEMPGLQRESTSRMEFFIYGDRPYAKIHELYFESVAHAQEAMASSIGQQAGRLLQQMTGGRMTLFIADHKEDDMENIHKYKPVSQSDD